MLDKLTRPLLLFDSVFKTMKNPKEDYNYQRDFLGLTNVGENEKEIFKPVTDIIGNDFVTIYNIKTSVYHQKVIQKVNYYIENRLWGLFSLALYDGFELSNDEFFKLCSIRVYLIISSRNEKKIVVVKSDVKHFEVLQLYKNLKVDIKMFQDRKKVYSIETGFISL